MSIILKSLPPPVTSAASGGGGGAATTTVLLLVEFSGGGGEGGHALPRPVPFNDNSMFRRGPSLTGRRWIPHKPTLPLRLNCVDRPISTNETQ
eukprot:7760331-Pyramimonas_sp.AAC.1